MSTLLLLSGGIDSSSIAAWLHPDAAVVIDYGQISAKGEIRAARAVADSLKLPLDVLIADCSAIGSGLLSGRDSSDIAPSKEWWPFRNQLLITLAGAWATNRGIRNLLVGSVKTDSFHVDGTENFYRHIDNLLSIQEGGLRVKAPAINMTTVELVISSKITEDIIGWTHSCHQSEWACGICPGCLKHTQVVNELREGHRWIL